MPIVEEVYVDEEMTPDTVRILLNRLKRLGSLDVDIQETLSMDWRTEHQIITDTMKAVKKQPSWVPRVGEIILFVRALDGAEICLQNSTREYLLYKDGNWRGHPVWEAGVVGQVPESTLEESDIVHASKSLDSVVYSGFRIEPLPDPNSKDKSFTKRYKYVPMSQIRPFIFHDDVLYGLPEAKWHSTINNARKIMSTVSLASRYHFNGIWPAAKISCRGVFIGSELICCGDVVRLLPEQTSISAVLCVEAIKLEFTVLDKATDDNDEAHPHNSSIYVYGQAFTTNISSSYKDAGDVPKPPVINTYDAVKWYPLQDPRKKYKVAFHRVASRLYEANALLLWKPQEGPKLVAGTEILSTGLAALRSSRGYSSRNNKRIIDGKVWDWGDSRAECLDIETLNSVSLSSHDKQRTDEKIYEWENAMKVLEHKATARDRANLNIMASAKSRAGGGMTSRPEVSAEDVAQAAAEEGLIEGELFRIGGTSIDDQSARRSDIEMIEQEGSDADTFHDAVDTRETEVIEDSQDELDQDETQGTSVMKAFGLGKQSPAKVEVVVKVPDKTATPPKQTKTPSWPSASMAQLPASTKPRVRPPKKPNWESPTQYALPVDDDIVTRMTQMPARAHPAGPVAPMPVSAPNRPRGRQTDRKRPAESSLKRALPVEEETSASDSSASLQEAWAAFKKPRVEDKKEARKEEEFAPIANGQSKRSSKPSLDTSGTLAGYFASKRPTHSGFAIVIDLD
jgi:hypothetical protein